MSSALSIPPRFGGAILHVRDSHFGVTDVPAGSAVQVMVLERRGS